MSPTFTESEVEDALLEWLASCGWQVLHGPHIAPDALTPERTDYGDVVLDRRLRAWGLANRRSLPLAIGNVAVAPAEYVIVRKLEYYRESKSDRHLRDIALMLRISTDQIDVDVLERWVVERGLSPEWALARNFEPG